MAKTRRAIAVIMICALALAGCAAQPDSSVNTPDINPKAESGQ